MKINISDCLMDAILAFFGSLLIGMLVGSTLDHSQNSKQKGTVMSSG